MLQWGKGVFASKPEAHLVEGENQLPKVVLTFTVCHGMDSTLAHNNIFRKVIKDCNGGTTP